MSDHEYPEKLKRLEEEERLEEEVYMAKTEVMIAEIKAMTPENRRKALVELVEQGVITDDEAFTE